MSIVKKNYCHLKYVAVEYLLINGYYNTYL